MIVSPSAGVAAAPMETAADLVGAPYAGSVAAAGSRLVWSIVEDGVGSIWTAQAPDFAPTRLTAYSKDDGLPAGDAALSPDGSKAAFVRGVWAGGNAASLVAGAERTVHMIDVATGAVADIGVGADPSFSPDGRLIFRRAGGLWVFENGQAKPLFVANGSVGAFSWSPDGRALAFVSQRSGYSVIGLYRLGADALTWLSDGGELDLSPAWSADGSMIAFLRVGAPARGGVPTNVAGGSLEIRQVEVASGRGRRLWRASGRDGGFVQTSRPDALRWTSDGSIVFLSEHDGWARLYRLLPGQDQAMAVSPEHCEVSDTAPTGDGALIFVSNCSDLARRSLWRLSRGETERLTEGAIDTDPRPFGPRFVAFRRGQALSPQQTAVLDLVTRKVTPLPTGPLGYDPTSLIEPQPISFRSADGKVVHGQIFAPKGHGRKPAIVFVHGGPEFQTYLGWHDLGVFGMSYAFNQHMARRGYVVLSVNYRMGTGYGRDWRLDPGAGPRGASEYADLLTAAQTLQGRADVDPKRIGVWGGSYGGYLTALALGKNSDVFAAGADISGFHDWTYRWASGGSPAEAYGVDQALNAQAWASSPLAYLADWTSPTLIVAGDRDRIIPIEESLDLARRLRAKGTPLVSSIVPDEEHIFVTHAATVRKLDLMSDFFDCALGASKVDVEACVAARSDKR